MSTNLQKRQRFIRHFKEVTGKKEVDMRAVAEYAQKMGWPLPKPEDPLDRLAKQFSEAAREEIRVDKQTRRSYRASLAITQRVRDGRQLTLWVDVDEAPRHHMVKGLTLYREQMVGEAVIATNTADHWNRAHPDEQPLLFEKDFTDDVTWRLSAADENERAS